MTSPYATIIPGKVFVDNPEIRGTIENTEEKKMAYNKNEYQKEYGKRTNYAAQKKWEESHTIKRINMMIDYDKNVDIFERLDSVPNKTAYILDLIRKDIENNPEI